MATLTTRAVGRRKARHLTQASVAVNIAAPEHAVATCNTEATAAAHVLGAAHQPYSAVNANTLARLAWHDSP